jgi:hypothetical protein
MNYPVTIIAALITIIVILINKNRKLSIENQNLYVHNDITVQLSSGSIGVNYFIRVRREKDFDITEQSVFLSVALKAAGFDSDTWREAEFRSLARQRGLESVIIEPR